MKTCPQFARAAVTPQGCEHHRGHGAAACGAWQHQGKTRAHFRRCAITPAVLQGSAEGNPLALSKTAGSRPTG
jgi:hypothetical protein